MFKNPAAKKMAMAMKKFIQKETEKREIQISHDEVFVEKFMGDLDPS